jgi:hypothetical protein
MGHSGLLTAAEDRTAGPLALATALDAPTGGDWLAGVVVPQRGHGGRGE